MYIWELAIPSSCKLTELGPLHVYAVVGHRIPRTLTEIGRLREITFRSVGEGTGRSGSSAVRAQCALPQYAIRDQRAFLWSTRACLRTRALVRSTGVSAWFDAINGSLGRHRRVRFASSAICEVAWAGEHQRRLRPKLTRTTGALSTLASFRSAARRVTQAAHAVPPRRFPWYAESRACDHSEDR